MATHDPLRDVQRFDAYRAALREAVGAETSSGTSPRAAKVRPLRRRRSTKTSG